MLPPVPYFTRADWLSSGILILVFLALIEAAASGVVHLQGRSIAARRINTVSRLVFPLIGTTAITACILL